MEKAAHKGKIAKDRPTKLTVEPYSGPQSQDGQNSILFLNPRGSAMPSSLFLKQLPSAPMITV